MFNAVFSGGNQGMVAYLVRVEVDLSRGLPGFDVVGSVGTEVREARERVQIALKNAGFPIPICKAIINLSPAHIRKEGTGYDLAIAAGLLACMEVWKAESLPSTAFLGELALNGEVRQIKGALPIVLSLKKQGIKQVVLPFENGVECTAVPGIVLIGIRKMSEFITFLQSSQEKRKFFLVKEESKDIPKAELCSKLNFADVYGQEGAKRAAEVAAAGFHHLLLAGPPGAGKTMIAQRIPGIMPPLTEEEQLEVSSIYSVAGKLEGRLMKTRPFLAPHHTISPQAFAGGGRIPNPGIISLAHRGVLFLDEMPEFSSAVLEVLRQPMEDKIVQIARSLGTYTFPSNFMLVCAMNPCPCGYFPDRNRCVCTEPDIRRYLSKISGPILDRIDIVAEASPVTMKDLRKKEKGEDTDTIRQRVMDARMRQKKRYLGSGYQFNGELPGREVERYLSLASEEQGFLEKVFETGQLSTRSYHKMIKLARTIADLEGTEEIRSSHLAEAVCYNNGKKRFFQ
ncbi:MAG TPA: YifB family Mg chelatase-like AAA ATPase [Lachnospiraceae bacterium]|nr:YifB family Mg chelatase-like AAA ATPase [Lachnospiraceae bacterium]